MREHEKEIASEEIGGSIPSRQEVCWSQRGVGGGDRTPSREQGDEQRQKRMGEEKEEVEGKMSKMGWKEGEREKTEHVR